VNSPLHGRVWWARGVKKLPVPTTALQFGQVNFPAFVASGLPQGEEASPLIAALLLQVDSMQVIDCYMAAIAVTEVFIAQINGNKKHEDIVAFVDSLPTVDLTTIPFHARTCVAHTAGQISMGRWRATATNLSVFPGAASGSVRTVLSRLLRVHA
jgi:hypothetical protein